MTTFVRRFLPLILLCTLGLIIAFVIAWFATAPLRAQEKAGAALITDLSCISGERTYTLEKVDGDYYFFLPSAANEATLSLSSNASGQATLTLGQETTLLSPGDRMTIRPTEAATTMTVLLDTQTIPVTLCRSADIPALFLSIDESRGTIEAMEADETKNTACYGDGTLLLPDGSTQSMGTLTLSGRGNSTWQREKKPYKLNLDEKADLLNMGRSRKWALLALYDDPALIRNMLGLSIAEGLDLNYVPQCKPVDLYLNGEYKGTYTLSERITLNPSRLDIVSLEDMVDAVLSTWNSLYGTKYKYLSDLMDDAPEAFVLSDDGSSVTVSLPAGDIVLDLTGGYLLEIDFYRDKPQLVLDSGTRITVKSPENLAPDIDDPLFSWLSGYLTSAEASLDDLENPDGYLTYFDRDSFAKMWIFKEFIMDYDACVSLYMTLVPGGKLEAGPAWDLENIFALNQLIYGMADPYYQVILNGGKHGTVKSWLTCLTYHPSFAEAINEIYETYATVFDGEQIAARAEEMMDLVSDSAAMNALLYPEKTREDESTFLPDLIRRRADAFPEVLSRATAEKEEIQEVPQ